MAISEEKPRKAVIFDLDGTLADVTARRLVLHKEPRNWDAFFAPMEQDPPNFPVLELFHALAQSGRYVMLVVTGRPSKYRQECIRWLRRNGIEFTQLHMRNDGESRSHLFGQSFPGDKWRPAG